MSTKRNEPCPCGSGLKYKKCCLGKTPAAEQIELDLRRHSRLEEANDEIVASFLSRYVDAAVIEELVAGLGINDDPFFLEMRHNLRPLQHFAFSQCLVTAEQVLDLELDAPRPIWELCLERWHHRLDRQQCELMRCHGEAEVRFLEAFAIDGEPGVLRLRDRLDGSEIEVIDKTLAKTTNLDPTFFASSYEWKGRTWLGVVLPSMIDREAGVHLEGRLRAESSALARATRASRLPRLIELFNEALNLPMELDSQEEWAD